MSRIAQTLASLRERGRKALIPYITAGDPHPDYTVGYLHDLVKAGADIIELGVPFSDPMADGPVIQLACERALAHGTSLRQVLKMVETFRRDDDKTPIVLMGYCNPLEAMGYEAFCAAASAAGVDGVLIVDMPPEEAVEYKALFADRGLDLIYLLAPTTTPDRIKRIADVASGYLYYVSLKGVTGAATLDVDDVKNRLETIRKLTNLPIGVGFGIKDADSASRVAAVADGVVVGSVLVNILGASADHPERAGERLITTLAEMRKAMDGG